MLVVRYQLVMSKYLKDTNMEDRIRIGNHWYVRERRAVQDPTMFRGCSFGKYSFNIIEIDGRLSMDTCWIEATGEVDIMDNIDFLKDFRDGEHEEALMADTSYSSQEDLRELLIHVTSLGWLSND